MLSACDEQNGSNADCNVCLQDAALRRLASYVRRIRLYAQVQRLPRVGERADRSPRGLKLGKTVLVNCPLPVDKSVLNIERTNLLGGNQGVMGTACDPASLFRRPTSNCGQCVTLSNANKARDCVAFDFHLIPREEQPAADEHSDLILPT